MNYTEINGCQFQIPIKKILAQSITTKIARVKFIVSRDKFGVSSTNYLIGYTVDSNSKIFFSSDGGITKVKYYLSNYILTTEEIVIFMSFLKELEW